MVFQFVQVGNDKSAEEYLRKLGTESEVAEYVHVIQGATVTEILDKLKYGSYYYRWLRRSSGFRFDIPTTVVKEESTD